ncbi:hypothetical protein NECID01_0025 [Nematocida sp. AWRm77]|nr:hypothetical protein NECID01_0025 [Nematocida sp. AWRm77]
MGEKESMLDKMKNAKSFLDTPNKQAKKKEVFAAQLVDTLEEAQTPLLAETPPADSTLLFSETATLFKRKDSEWSKVSSGKIVGKEEPGQGVQILFFMENTRMALNTLHTEKDKITLNGAHLVLVATEEKEASVVCFLFKNESTAKKVHAGIEESKADKMSPPGIEPGTSSV